MIHTIWFLLVIAILLFYIHRIFYTYDSKFLQFAKQFPGPKWLPIIGTVYTFGMNPDSVLHTLIYFSKIYQPISGHWIGPEFYTIVSKSTDIEVILNSTTSTEKGRHVYKFLAKSIGDGLLTSKGEKWKKHREIINPMFYSNALRHFVKTFYSKANHTCDLMESEVNNTGFDIFSYIELCGLRILIASVVTEDYDSQYNYESTEVLENINKIRELTVYRITKLYSNTIYDKLLCGKRINSSIKYTYKTLLKMAEKTKTRIHFKKTVDEVQDSFLEFMFKLQTNSTNKLTDEEILDEIRTIIAIGVETCTAAVGFTLFLLSRHCDIQKKVVDEIKEKLGSLEDKLITYSDVSKLEYLDRVVKESLRLYPPVPYIVRHVLEDIELPSGYTLPSGSNALVMFYCMHRDPDVFPNPEGFDPDNFLPENVASREPFVFAPFSFGPRNCIGQEYAMLSLKTQIVVILKRFSLTPANVEPKLIAAIGLRSSNGIHLCIQRRVDK